jgi:hypothetical protein
MPSFDLKFLITDSVHGHLWLNALAPHPKIPPEIDTSLGYVHILNLSDLPYLE